MIGPPKVWLDTRRLSYKEDFVLAKAGNDAELARESLAHLERYIRLLFRVAEDMA